MPDYYLMNRSYLDATEMMNDTQFKPEYTLNGESATPDLTDMDIVVAVPVCAGLSMAVNVQSQERKDTCNAQMIWFAKFVLKTIKPKVYIFENAPTLMSSRGDDVRDQLETIAFENGYTCVYYKTDTKFHHNCQKRPRTFIFFFKNRNSEKFIPELFYERNMINVQDFFDEMGELRQDDPMNVVMENKVNVDVLIDYFIEYYGENWHDYVNADIEHILSYNKDERNKYMVWLEHNVSNERYPEKFLKFYKRYFNHIDEKRADNKGWWITTAKLFKDYLPACMHKNAPTCIHYKENCLYTMREWLFAMGNPTDFDMIGTPINYFRKIGQNVPVNTANFVVSEAVRIIEGWDTIESVDKGQNVAFFDNSKQKRIW